MSILILNWAEGENDPFSYFSACAQQLFEQVGCTTHVLTITDRLVQNLEALMAQRIAFVVSWQGIGSTIGATPADPTTIWDRLKVPVICCHGDHPCHQPVNHKALSPWIHHLYGTPSFTTFANRYIPRHQSATFCLVPPLFPDGVQNRFAGDYFIFPKNLDDLDATMDSWRFAPQRRTAAFLLEAADAIISEFRNGNRREHHAIIDDMLTPDVMVAVGAELNNDAEIMVRFHLHAILDKIHRNAVAEHIVTELEDVPMHIYGRGWERFCLKQNPNHQFLSFGSMSNNAFQFASNYGILDAAPSHDMLHDRTFRAIANRAGFLMGSNWNHELFLGADYGDLFFDGTPGVLRERAARVMADPPAHRERCCEFARDYQQHSSVYGFVKHLEAVSAQIRAHASY